MLENDIINRLYYTSTKTNSFKCMNSALNKNSSLLLSPINRYEKTSESFCKTEKNIENKTISKTSKKIDSSDFINYLDKLANYENNKKTSGKILK